MPRIWWTASCYILAQYVLCNRSQISSLQDPDAGEVKQSKDLLTCLVRIAIMVMSKNTLSTQAWMKNWGEPVQGKKGKFARQQRWKKKVTSKSQTGERTLYPVYRFERTVWTRLCIGCWTLTFSRITNYVPINKRKRCVKMKMSFSFDTSLFWFTYIYFM